MTDDARPDPDDLDAVAEAGQGDDAASDRLTPGGARLRNRPAPQPQPEPEPEAVDEADAEGAAPAAQPASTGPELPELPRRSIDLKKYYIGVILLLVGIGLGLYGFVDIWGGRNEEGGGITMVTAAKVALGGALMMYGQNMVRVATNDPRARKR